ncbi:hypothetical protein BHE74_00034337 [Ensete ventricosum]|nr:hypothetical protein BHE74_00034337 [Ensete ventricosum]RZS06805.1 hypothetical protein BHM03_00037524 [Ensete ventricosum]
MLPGQVGLELGRVILDYQSGLRWGISSGNYRRVPAPQNLEHIQPKKILHMKGVRVEQTRPTYDLGQFHGLAREQLGEGLRKT